MNRRHFIRLALLAGAAPAARAAKPPVILVLGDSLSAEYGIARGSGWVALLEKKLADGKTAATVENASISGDTTAGGRARLPVLLKKYQPTIVVIELGGNDALRGLPLDMTEANLTAMTQAAQQAGARVLLAGMQVPPNYGADYGRRFQAVFAHVAQAQQAALVPFLLQGVGDAQFQPDRIHPTAAAHPTILANVWPVLQKLLK